MKAVGWILIAIGIIMVVVRGFSIPVEKNIVDAGPIQISKTENKWIGWPTYAGGILAIIGVIMVGTAKKQS